MTHHAHASAGLLCVTLAPPLLQVDIKNRKHLLKKTWYQDLKPEHLFVGSTVTVYARQMKIVDYGDDYTRAKLTPHSER